MKNKIILMILNQHFPPDIRVEQELLALQNDGFRVIIVANNSGEINSSYEIIRVDHTKGKSSILNMSLSYNPFLRNKIIQELSNKGIYQISVIHVHDLLWSFLGFQLKKHYGSKIIIDLHENYPEYIKDINKEHEKASPLKFNKQGIITCFQCIKHPIKTILKILNKKAYSVKRLIKYEDKILTKCDRFIVVIEEGLDRFKLKKYYNKGVVVRNTKDPSIWKYVDLPEFNGKLILSYVGSVQYLRGLDTAIMAMKYLNQSDYALNIVGINPKSKIYETLTHIIKENNISNVNMIPWLKNEAQAFSYIEQAHICIIPHHNTGLTREAAPHKLFMYMAIGRPMLVSDVGPLKRIVNEVKSGLIFKAGDPKDFSEKVKEYKNLDLLTTFSLNGRQAAENQHAWSQDKKRLLEMYNNLLLE